MDQRRPHALPAVEWVKLVLIWPWPATLPISAAAASPGKTFSSPFCSWPSMILVIRQPDLGTTLTYTPILVAGLFLGGISLRQGLILTAVSAMLIVGVWSSGKLSSLSKSRLSSFIKPRQRPRGTGYQIRQSLIAVGSGGVWGKARQKAPRPRATFSPSLMPTSSLPHSVRSTALSARFWCCCYTSSY